MTSLRLCQDCHLEKSESDFGPVQKKICYACRYERQKQNHRLWNKKNAERKKQYAREHYQANWLKLKMKRLAKNPS